MIQDETKPRHIVPDVWNFWQCLTTTDRQGICPECETVGEIRKGSEGKLTYFYLWCEQCARLRLVVVM